MAEERRIIIDIPALVRVEGEAALHLVIDDGRIDDLRLRIYEPPRLFEQFLVGRDAHEVPDLVARICGICPVAYQMSAVHAIEAIASADPGPWVRDMRRVYYCGEWIESHSLHIHLLAAPDFLGFNTVTEMARVHPEEVRRGLRLQALGNDIIKLFGGRSVHPVGARLGGFYRAPDAAEVDGIVQRLRAALPEAQALVQWVASLNLGQEQQEFTSVALRHADEYPMNEGRIVSSRGLNIAIRDFEAHFKEHQVPHSTALHCLLGGEPYLVGPLARLNLNLDRLPQEVRAALRATGIEFPSRNMYHSIVARAVEVYYAIHEALRLLTPYHLPESSHVEIQPQAGVGFGCTEAPRGILWHRYEVNDQGLVLNARIVPPTSQNQARIEENLRNALEQNGLDRPEEVMRLQCEQIIRNYDPCISCATHFLDLRVDRR